MANRTNRTRLPGSWYNFTSVKSANPVIGHLAALFTIFVWGITFISTKALLAPFTPVEIMFYRLLVAVLVLVAISPPRPPWGSF